MASRREFMMALGGTLVAVGARQVIGQQGAEAPGASMEGDGYIPVRRLPRPAAATRLTPLERDAVLGDALDELVRTGADRVQSELVDALRILAASPR